ncbi:DUF5103 domain-containing protein [Flavobacterium sp.]|uniref:type IX secretion system plug protein n=1 Tax=Flavobacterium sp. TaxID=239 RepID=UPI00286B8DEF|nr:DUF5103 domain-containing protein [Flavobacterium sp.]
MLKSLYTIILLVLTCALSNAQEEKEVIPPYNIKTVSFVQNGQNIVPIFQLGDTFQLAFDDLFGNEANYYYQIVHCDYDWKPSQLSINEYMQGFDNQRIQDYTNSYNTLQVYSHYKIQFPNKNTRLLVSGNYMIKIVNEDRDVVFSRKFIMYENLVTVSSQVKRARNVADVNYKHNMEFTIKSTSITFQSPLTNVKILLLQNGQLNSGITNIKPMYTIGNDLIYKYDAETQFWAGNEFRYFENKDIRSAVNNIARIDSQGGVYNGYLYTDEARSREQYSYNPDINGNFITKNLNAENNDIEADYAWIFFSLSAPSYFDKKDIYVNGMFNNYAISPENKMDYNAEKSVYEKAIMIKQGFTNYQYVVADKSGKIDAEKAIDGNFYQTVSDYFTLIYYKENSQRYDRIIGKSVVTSENIIN